MIQRFFFSIAAALAAVAATGASRPRIHASG
jgi:hypothetical protein